jgi:hypothetical protein
MNDIRWFNPSQPQTLQIAVLLLYLNAFFALLGLLLPFVLLLAAGAVGIASEKKWGYAVGVAAAILQVAVLLMFGGFAVLNNLNGLLQLMFDGALVALLLHPMSREYQRIWFH